LTQSGHSKPPRLCYYRALKTGLASGVAQIDKMSLPLVTLFAAALIGKLYRTPRTRAQAI
jgi:uncharacterized membrane protein